MTGEGPETRTYLTNLKHWAKSLGPGGAGAFEAGSRQPSAAELVAELNPPLRVQEQAQSWNPDCEVRGELRIHAQDFLNLFACFRMAAL